MNVRHQQIEATLKRVISEVLVRGDLGDPRLRGLVSVTAVKVSPDRRHAVIDVSVIPQEHEALSLEALRSATPLLQRKVFKALAQKIVPRIEFRLDRSLKKSAEVLQAIREGVEQDLQRQQERERQKENLPPSGSPDEDEPNAPH